MSIRVSATSRAAKPAANSVGTSRPQNAAPGFGKIGIPALTAVFAILTSSSAPRSSAKSKARR